MYTPSRCARAVWPGHAHRRPSPRAFLVLASALLALCAFWLPVAPAAPAGTVLAQNATPTPLPTLSASSLPDVNPGKPRPEPLGHVFGDSSADNSCLQGAGESGIAGAMVRLKDGSGDILRQQLTNSYGLYDLLDAQVSLPSGTYTIDVVPPSGSSFRCVKPGTANQAQQQQPVTIQSPDLVPDELLVNFGLQ